ncbi:hypothetical protein JCM5353_008356 [Sporobolomyces roseus]
MDPHYPDEAMDLDHDHERKHEGRQEWQLELSDLVEKICQEPRAEGNAASMNGWRNRMKRELGITVRERTPLPVCIRDRGDFVFVKNRLLDLLGALRTRDKPVFGQTGSLLDEFEPSLIRSSLPSAFLQSFDRLHISPRDDSARRTPPSFTPPHPHNRLPQSRADPSSIPSRLPPLSKDTGKNQKGKFKPRHRRNRVSVIGNNSGRNANLASRLSLTAAHPNNHSVFEDRTISALQGLNLAKPKPDVDGAIKALEGWQCHSLSRIGRISCRRSDMYGLERNRCGRVGGVEEGNRRSRRF